jgi:hypothetical protein
LQTYLPFPDFRASARALDYRRLGKQRVECYQILRVLGGHTRAWRTHPAVLMWRGHRGALVRYAIAICREWRRRGYRDSLLPKFLRIAARLHPRESRRPPWIGDPALHSAYRAALLAKQPDWYAQFAWSELPQIAYLWPRSAPVSRS